MTDIKVVSQTQRIVINPATSSISVINAGPVGPSNGGPGGGGPLALDDLSDVSIVSHDAGRILAGNGTDFIDVLGTSLFDAAGTAQAKFDQVVNGAGAAYDTLLKLGALIVAGDTAAAALATTVAGKQAAHANLTALASQTITAFALALLTDPNAPSARTRIDVYSKGEVDTAISTAGAGVPTTLTALTDVTIGSHATGRILAGNGTEFVDILGSTLFDPAGTAQTKVDAVIAGAGPAFDTLVKLGNLISTDETTAAALATTVAGKQPLHANLTALAGQAVTAFALALLTDANAPAARTRIDVYSKAEVDGFIGGVSAGAPRGVRYVAQPTGNPTTDAAAIVTAFNAIPAGTIVEFYPNGLYQIDQTTLTGLPKRIKIKTNGAQIMGDASINAVGLPSDGYKAALRITGSISASVAITTAIAPGGISTTIASNAIGIAKGSWITLVSNKLYSPPRNEHQYGQHLTVRDITGAGPYTVTFEEAVIDDYALADVPVLRKITGIQDLEIDRGTVGLENDVTLEPTRASGMVLKYIDGFELTNMKVDGNDYARCGLVVRSCRRGRVWIHVENIADTGGDPPLGREAYGFIVLSSDDIEMHVTGRRCRHLMDVGGFGDEPPSDRIKVWYEGSLTWAGVGSAHGGARRINWVHGSANHGGGGLILRNRQNEIGTLHVIGTHAQQDPNATNQSNQHGLQCGETSNYAQRTLTLRERQANVVKMTTSAAHGYDVGAKVTIAGVSDATFNGNFVITSIPSTTTFTFAQVGSTVAVGTATTGTADGDDYGAPGAINLKAERIYMDLTQRDGSTTPYGMYFKGPVDNVDVDNFTCVGNVACAVMVHGEYTKSMHFGVLDVDCTKMNTDWPIFAVAPGGGNVWEGQVPTVDNGETFDLITIDLLRVRNPTSAPVAIMGGTVTTKSGKLHIKKLELVDHSTGRFGVTEPLVRILGGYVGEVQIDVIDAPLMRRSKIISLENGAILDKRTIGSMNGAIVSGSAGRTDEPVKYPGTPRPPSYGAGVCAYSFPPGGSSSATIPTSGTLHVTAIDVPPMNITGFGLMQTLAGTAVTSGFGAYFQKAVGGARLGVTADTVASWQTTGPKTPALVTPFDWDGGELYMAFFVVWTGTGPTFMRGSSGAAANLNALATLPLAGVANAGISAMPATLGTMSIGSTSANFMVFPIGTLL